MMELIDPVVYYRLAFQLLEIKGLPAPRTFGFQNDTYFDDEEWQQLCNVILKHVPGISAADWWNGTEGQRVALMKDALAAVKPQNRMTKVTSTAVEVLLGEESHKILTIVHSKKSADDRMREICGIDRAKLGWNSIIWAKLLGVTDGGIRQTHFWKVDRKKAIEENN
ncbi:MAG: hypothetical protein O2955_06325 [Planctomycetota bacterium]|nr:hypothetical protein [Pseudomonadota bacterium]MDA1212111.1 hypothetical protein [Planctomycetota bacterium]